MKLKRIVLIVAGLLIAAGLVLSFTAWASTGFDLQKLSTVDSDRYETLETHYDAAGLSDIEIRIEVDDLEVRASADDKIHLRYVNYDGLYYEVSTVGGVLTLEQMSKSGWFRFDFLMLDFSADKNVVLELPAGYDGDVRLSCDVGEIDIKAVSLEGALEVHQGTGALRAEDVQAASVTASSSVGDLRGSGWQVAQGISLTTGTGYVLLEDSTAETLYCATDVGQMKLARVTAQTSRLNTEVGDIRLDALDTQQLTAETDVGEVKGTLAGAMQDYTILTDTDVGDNNLKDQLGTGARNLDINTETGDIHLEFLD